MNPSAVIERDRVGPYVLVKAIGAGGSARVDLARIERAYGFQRHVVIKRPLEHLRGDARAAESLRREARLGGQLRHPNLVAILDAGMHDGYDYLVLEYVHGGSLRQLMQTEDGGRVRDVSLEVALSIVRDVARGVHEAHELHDEHGAPLGLVHRDVSPGNVLIGLDGAVKLADFGIAKETRVATLSGSMHGTVTYMAPEQCRGHAFDRRADIFSLGVILYELVTGTRLFWADNDVASLHRVLAGTVPRPRKVRANITPVLEEISMTAVAHEPGRRFTTARDLADAVERHGAELGQILAARSVARWVHESVGPRDAPWIGGGTAIDPPTVLEDADLEPFGETSLIPIIESTPPPEEPPSATFGPSDAAMFEDAPDTQPSHAPMRRRDRTVMAAVIGACAIAGVAIAVIATRGDDAPAPAPRAAPVSAPAADPAPAAAVGTPEAASAEAVELENAVDELDEAASEKPGRKRTRRRPKRAETKPPAPAPQPAGVDKSNPKVEWDPTMLLPTDKKKN